MANRLIRTVFIIVCTITLQYSQAQERSFRRVYVGIEGSWDFFSNTIATEKVSSPSVDAVVRNNNTSGRSGGAGAGGRLIVGYRLNRLISFDVSAGIGLMTSTVDTEFSSSETYNNIGTYSASDRIALMTTFSSYEASVHRLLTELNTRRKRRFVNARFGLGVLVNKNKKGLLYQEHSWPIVGIVFEDNGNDSPVVYDDTKLMDVANWPFVKLGVEYESRGPLGLVFSFDTHLYKPNLFNEESVIVGQEQNTSTPTRVTLKDNILAYSVTVGFFINRRLRN